MVQNISEEIAKLLEASEDKFSKEELDLLRARITGYWSAEVSSRFFASLYPAKLLESALKEHAQALARAAEASDRYARSLTWATWALVAVTFLLVIVTALSVYRGC